MVPFADSAECCRHDRAPLRRLGKVTHERTGQRVYVLLCTACGFTVTTDQLRRLREEARRPRRRPPRRIPTWLPLVP